MRRSLHKPSAAHEAFYQEAMVALQDVIRRHPNIRNLEIIALFGQAVAVCVAACYPQERDLARLTAIENIDQRLKDLGVEMPDPPAPQG